MTQKEKFDLDTNRLQNNCRLVNSLIEVDLWRDMFSYTIDSLRKAFGIPADFISLDEEIQQIVNEEYWNMI